MFKAYTETLKTITYPKRDLVRFNEEIERLKEKGYRFLYPAKEYRQNGEDFVYNTGVKLKFKSGSPSL